VRLHERSVHHLHEPVEALDGLGGRAEANEVVQERRLERAHPVVLHDLQRRAQTSPRRNEVAAPGLEPRPRPLRRRERRRHGAVADGLHPSKRRFGRIAFAEQQVSLGDAHVRPDQCCLLA
jgi:hypothetical protein